MGTMIVGTHNGTFHADEVMACAILSTIANARGDVMRVIRTRSKELLAGADILVDVGEKYDGERFFDHHQRGGAGERPNGIQYSSAGLCWKRFGSEYVRHLFSFESAEVHARIADEVDVRLIQGICAQDCGQRTWEPTRPSAGVPATFSQIVSWHNSPEDVHDNESAFHQMVHLAYSTLVHLATAIRREIAAERHVLSAMAKRPDKEILVLDEGMPWQKTVLAHSEYVLYVVFPSGGTWRVQAVPEELGSFTPRLRLPQEWAGLPEEELRKITGVADAVFCHPGRFICGARTKEGALALARLAL